MKALLVYKKSIYETYIEKHKMKSFSENDKARFYDSHVQNSKAIEKVEEILIANQIRYVKTHRAEPYRNDSRFDFIVAVGGDGTFMESTRSCYGQQFIIGVNSDPERSFGHYCMSVSEFESVISDIENVSLETRYRLSVVINGKEHSFPAMNDVLIHHKSPAGLTRYELYSTTDDCKEEHFCSGLWVCTPSGQTGAINSAMYPDKFKLDLNGGKMGFKPVCLNRNRKKEHVYEYGISQELVIFSKMREGKIFIDGEHVVLDFKIGDVLTLCCDVPIKFVRKPLK